MRRPRAAKERCSRDVRVHRPAADRARRPPRHHGGRDRAARDAAAAPRRHLHSAEGVHALRSDPRQRDRESHPHAASQSVLRETMTGAARPQGTRRRPLRVILAGALAGVTACCAAAASRGLPPAHGTESLVIRVGILVDRPSVQISADGPVTAEDVSVSMFTAPVPVVLPQPPGGRAWIATAGGNAGLDLSGTPLGPAVRLTAQHGLLRADGRPYRGALELRRTPAGQVTVVNVLDLESYLYGVIKGEVDPRWPPEAVRAQAVAARTLAVQRMLAHASAQDAGSAGAAFDLAATTDAQLYLGAAAEDPAATAAVDATRGLVLTYDGRPIL